MLFRFPSLLAETFLFDDDADANANEFVAKNPVSETLRF